MLRIVLVVLLPLVTPFLVYAGCVWLLRRRRSGPAGSAPIDWRSAPLAWILIAGICCSLAAFLYLRFTTGVPPGTKLEPPHWVDGVIVPSHPVDGAPRD